MKTGLFVLGGLVVLLGGVTASGAHAQTGIPHPLPVQRMQRRERHPELQRALRALQNAKTALQKADRDFGGHRAKAMDLTEQAIQETKAAIAYDKH